MMSFDQQGADSRPGIFITFEGGEGAGKSTHIRFLADALRTRGHEVLCVREPGGTVIGEKLRGIVLDTENGEMTDQSELFIYEAARSQIVSQVIEPALLSGAVVLCDRFSDSTLAYQVYGRGLDKDFVEAANAFACQGVTPDRTILLTCGASARTGLERATHHGDADRLEQAGEAFHTRVNDGFLQIAEENPDRVRLVVSADRKSQTARKIFDQLSDVFPWMDDDACKEDTFFAVLDVKSSRSSDLSDAPAHTKDVD